MFSRRKLKGGDIGRNHGHFSRTRCAQRSSAVEKLICEGTPDLVHEFLAFVAPALGARSNFSVEICYREGSGPVNLPFMHASSALRAFRSPVNLDGSNPL
jgi:hypothetical protein